MAVSSTFRDRTFLALKLFGTSLYAHLSGYLFSITINATNALASARPSEVSIKEHLYAKAIMVIALAKDITLGELGELDI